MPDLTGTKISNTYKRLMQVKSSDNAGITSSLQTRLFSQVTMLTHLYNFQILH